MAFSVISLLGMFITLKRTHQQSKELDKKVKIRTNILNEMAYTDSLTLIANRRAYEEFCDNIINKKCANSLPLAIIIYDLDHFKQINDQYGHDMGDECLIATVEAVSAILPADNNFHARIGGEEFAIILKHVSNEQLEQTVQRILESVRQVKVLKQPDIKVTCSIGATLATELNETTIKSIVKTADDALYEAKSLGRDQYVSKPYDIHHK